MELTEVWEHFNQRLGHIGPVVIAGGAVRDRLMGRQPKDWDIFILGGQSNLNYRGRVATALRDLPTIQPIASHQYEPFLITTVEWREVQVQVMVNPAEDLPSLVDTFDWSVSLFGYGEGGIYQLTRVDDIAPGKELILHRCTFPLSTLRRGFRFSERFQMDLPNNTVVDLCQRIISKAVRKSLVGPRGATPDMPALAANLLVDNG